ncbi:MAG TPA: PAS domain S-box protein [Pyrinomonadaceae bacterium]|nr:PAS domain S-box protein [Pyrinomonadaceae bacterium]
MTDLPTPVRDFILELTEDTRSPAYMLVGEDNGLLAWGGDWGAHDVTGLDERMDVAEHITFLHGMLPLETPNVYLPNVQTHEGLYADVYLFQRKEGTWVLLLDATADAAARQRMQQKANTLRLQVAELEHEEESLYEEQGALEARVRERTAELTETNRRLKKELQERERIEQELRKSESRFRRLFESNMIGIMFWDMKGAITAANDAFLETLGYNQDDLRLGQLDWDQITQPDKLTLDENAFTEMRATGACSPFLREFRRKDGTPVVLLFGAALLEGSRNSVVCFTLDVNRYK